MAVSRKEKTKKLLAKEFLPKNASQKRPGIVEFFPISYHYTKFSIFQGYRHMSS